MEQAYPIPVAHPGANGDLWLCDFHLSPQGPCVSKGDEDAACLLGDLVGLARDLGVAFDLGKETCFESFLK